MIRPFILLILILFPLTSNAEPTLEEELNSIVFSRNSTPWSDRPNYDWFKRDVKVSDVIRWYNEPVGCSDCPRNAQVIPYKEFYEDGSLMFQTTLVDGLAEGWAFNYEKNGGKLYKKDYYKNGDLAYLRRFEVAHAGNSSYAIWGNGRNVPLIILKNGKPFDGYLKFKLLFEGGSDGDNAKLKSIGDDDFDFFYIVKNGYANGASVDKSISDRIVSSTFRDGFKHGEELWASKGHFRKILYDRGTVVEKSEFQQ